MAHMEEKFTETISVEALASDLSISPRHFKRRFKSATGDSPLTYLQRIRIEFAKQQLETTMETVDEITWLVGSEITQNILLPCKRILLKKPMCNFSVDRQTPLM